MAILLNGPIITCLTCSSEFKSTSNRSKYCSKPCGQKAKYNSHKVAKQRWKETHKDQIRVIGQLYYKKKGKDRQLQHKYNLSEVEFHRMLEQQGYKCKICNRPIAIFTENRMDRAAIDHDHKTNKVRGILCTKCNVGLGSFKDSPEFLRSAADYIEFYA